MSLLFLASPSGVRKYFSLFRGMVFTLKYPLLTNRFRKLFTSPTDMSRRWESSRWLELPSRSSSPIKRRMWRCSFSICRKAPFQGWNQERSVYEQQLCSKFERLSSLNSLTTMIFQFLFDKMTPGFFGKSSTPGEVINE